MNRVAFLPMDHAPPPPDAVLAGEKFVAGLVEELGQIKATVTASGRAALAAVFRHIRLRPEHEVFITTTFGYANVSSCVTCTVFNFCKPSRVLGARTQAILVIHEFGVPHPETPALRQEATRRGIPLIEDCAHGIASVAPSGWRLGELADWSILSLPKLFAVPAGGVLVGPTVPYLPSAQESREIRAAVRLASAWWPTWHDQVQQRRKVYGALAHAVSKVGLKPLVEPNDDICPWFFPVQVSCPDAIRHVAREQGVDCGLWHGSDVVVFPCHQFLNEEHVHRIAAVLERAAEPELIAGRLVDA